MLGKTLSVLLLLPTLTQAQQLTPQQTSRIDSVFARVSGNTAPGCVVGVGRNGQLLFERGYGMSDLEHDVPLTANSVVEIGSVSKQFTTGSIVLLAQDGKLSLEDDVRKWVPELPDFGKKITIRMLANHTSGLRDQWGLLGLLGNPPGTQVHSNALILDLLSRQQKLNFPSNDQYLYSNSGYVLLATIVQRASGKSLAEFSTERIFKPLGMNDTQWRDDHQRVVKRRALAYTPAGTAFRSDMPFTNVYGNGGLLTTVKDMTIWWDALLNNKLGGPGFTDAMTTRAVLNRGDTIAYALGVSVGNYRGVRELSHGGATAGYRAHLAAYPDSKVAIAVLCNRADAGPEPFLHSVADVLLASELKPVPAMTGPTPVAVPASELNARAGMYRNRNTEEVVELAARSDRLVGTRFTRLELIPLGNDLFRRALSTQEARFVTVGGKVQLQLGTTDGTPNIYEKTEPVTPTPAQLAQYAGKYLSPELGFELEIAVDQDALVLKRRAQQPIRLMATFKDGFTGNGSYVFTRDAAGKVTGFSITAGRVRGVWFARQ